MIILRISIRTRPNLCPPNSKIPSVFKASQPLRFHSTRKISSQPHYGRFDAAPGYRAPNAPGQPLFCLPERGLARLVSRRPLNKTAGRGRAETAGRPSGFILPFQAKNVKHKNAEEQPRLPSPRCRFGPFPRKHYFWIDPAGRRPPRPSLSPPPFPGKGAAVRVPRARWAHLRRLPMTLDRKPEKNYNRWHKRGKGRC